MCVGCDIFEGIKNVQMRLGIIKIVVGGGIVGVGCEKEGEDEN